ncbi:formamidopyrimidine-DNA glycosylase, partial [Staphylococcus aureus]
MVSKEKKLIYLDIIRFWENRKVVSVASFPLFFEIEPETFFNEAFTYYL